MSIIGAIVIGILTVILTWLFITVGRGTSRAIRGLGRKSRAARNALAEELAQGELRTGELLLWVDRQREQPGAGVFITLIGIFSLWAFIAMLIFMSGAIALKLIVCIPLILYSLFMMYLGIFIAFRQHSNYFFVTDQRFATRGSSLTGKQLDQDVAPDKIKDVKLIDYRVNGIHANYRVHIMIDIGKRKPRLTAIMPERDSASFANAVNSIRRI